jgi:hypothetical protein
VGLARFCAEHESLNEGNEVKYNAVLFEAGLHVFSECARFCVDNSLTSKAILLRMSLNRVTDCFPLHFVKYASYRKIVQMKSGMLPS